jgi:hypothetical protein
MAIEINRGNNNCISMSGIGYVIIPDGSDPAEYVQRCYRNHAISIGGGYGSTAMHNVKITESALNSIKFPTEGKTQGSPVIWIRESFSNKPIVVGVLFEGGTSNLNINGQESLRQEISGRVAEVFLDALSSRVNITALGDSANYSEINIKASSGQRHGDVVNVESKDLVKVGAQSYKLNLTKDFELTIDDGKNTILHIVSNKDEFNLIDQWNNNIILDAEKVYMIDAHGNQIIANADEVHLTDAHGNEAIFNEDNTQFLTKEFNIGQGNEQMVLGNTLVDLLGQLIDAILSMTVVTHVGPSGTPVNAATFSAIKSKLETALSKLSNTD